MAIVTGAPDLLDVAAILHRISQTRADGGERAPLAGRPDGGANTVVRKYHETTHFVEVHDRGILLDIDDPQAYLELGREGPPGA